MYLSQLILGTLDPHNKDEPYSVKFYEKSEVVFDELPKETIEAYVATGEPMYVHPFALLSEVHLTSTF